ncbi:MULTISPECIES: ABC transporter permease subunit [Lysinibacillus]|uniref:ABC transporter permease subunit n=1 Tax=Lysinibacillus TaxID=400634 RepID=UPI00257F858C|nr:MULTISPECIES: ABC transporter permease subunit [Lysinibacillus]
MNITWLEMKKALYSPTILILLVLFSIFNIFTIISHSYGKDELKIANVIIEKYGEAFNDDILDNMQKDLNADVKKLVPQFQDANAFINSMNDEKYQNSTLAEQHEIDRIHLMQLYINLGKSLDERYSKLNIETLKEGTIADFGLTNWSADVITREFDKLNNRFTEMKETKEYKKWFFASNYRMHSELFKNLIKKVAMEGVILVVLLTALITNYEFEHRTQLVTYASKKGRLLMWHKLIASLLTTLLILSLLFGISLITFFTVYDYSGVWTAPITSGLNWEYTWPHITWWPIELWKYLLLTITILVITLLIISLLTFCISTFLRNSYLSWILCILILVSMFVVPMFFSGMPTLLLLMHFNLILLLLNPHQYFSGVSNLMMFEYHEVWTLVLWGLISLLCVTYVFRRFNRKDIV